MKSILHALAAPLLLMLAPAMAAQAAGRSRTAAQAAVDAAADAESPAAMESIPASPITEPYGRAWSGAADGDVTLVIFADYGCPPCREAQKATDRLIAEDPKLRVVYRFIAFEGYPGRAPAYASLDAAAEEIYDKQGSDGPRPNTSDWTAFHRALMARGAVTTKAIAEVARGLGLPAGMFHFDYSLTDPMQSHYNAMSYDSELGTNQSELEARGGTSLPAWTIGEGQVTEGHDYAAIKAAIAQARAAARK